MASRGEPPTYPLCPPPYPPPPTPPPATPPAAPPPEAVTSLLIQSAGTAEERVAQLRLGRQLASAREELALLTAGLEGDELGGEMGMGLDAPVRRAAAQPLSIDAAVRYDGQRCAAAAVADAAAALSARVVAVGGVDAMGREGQPFPEGTQQRWHIRHGWQHRPGRGLPGGGGAGGGGLTVRTCRGVRKKRLALMEHLKTSSMRSHRRWARSKRTARVRRGSCGRRNRRNLLSLRC